MSNISKTIIGFIILCLIIIGAAFSANRRVSSLVDQAELSIPALSDQDLSMNLKSAAESGKVAMTIVTMGGLTAIVVIGTSVFIVSRDIRRREEAEEQMDRFFTLSLDLLCISGMDGYFKRLSPAYQDVLGYTLEELYRIPIVDLIHPDDVDKTTAEIARQAQGSRVLSFENRFRCKNGSYKTLSWKSVPAGQFMYAVARDVTSQKLFEAELMSAQKASEQMATAKTEFLANMSHELRTPLNGILGAADLLARTSASLEHNKYLKTIHRSGERLLKIINEILDFSKIEARKMELEILDFEFAQLIENQISLIGVSAHDKGLSVKADLDPNIPPNLRGDSGRISQILLNLLSNAVKFTEKGSITLKTELLSANENKCTLKFSILDSGIGIPQDKLTRLFLPFMQADGSTARRYGGTGLGLSISKRLAELMGGKMGVESEEGKGSTFWLHLPLEVSHKVIHQPVSSAVTSSSHLDRKNVRVLVAEDNHVNQMIIMKMLERLGYSAQIVANGQEAVDAYKQKPFDMILMDRHMPVLDGMESAALIRNLELATGKRSIIFAFTANVLQESQMTELADLMDDYILKPVTLTALEATLNKWEPKLQSLQA